MTFLHSTVLTCYRVIYCAIMAAVGQHKPQNVAAQPNDLAPRIDPDWYQVEILPLSDLILMSIIWNAPITTHRSKNWPIGTYWLTPYPLPPINSS